MLGLSRIITLEVESARPTGTTSRIHTVRTLLVSVLGTLLAPFYLTLWCSSVTAVSSILYASIASIALPPAWFSAHNGYAVALRGSILYGIGLALALATHVTLSSPLAKKGTSSSQSFPAPVGREMGILATVLSVLGGSVAPAIGVVTLASTDVGAWDALVVGVVGMSMPVVALVLFAVVGYAVFRLQNSQR
ncbi:hypothetical protein L227DRAFT_581641 [Lentinus tigrinus ALCF2SS1-6]|uniref:Uncharacterized protein n=1 Tax=Lentinus tigrinus ALCF2SS1-6 TaxID=1328759 RepID=A0A5C2RQE3_9APHY|nr:hypothetical protein L227DRAFT_581641 [Lentinus tigrinus ALCF2SS1-6]